MSPTPWSFWLESPSESRELVIVCTTSISLLLQFRWGILEFQRWLSTLSYELLKTKHFMNLQMLILWLFQKLYLHLRKIKTITYSLIIGCRWCHWWVITSKTQQFRILRNEHSILDISLENVSQQYITLQKHL